MSGREMVAKPWRDRRFRLRKRHARQWDRCCWQQVDPAAWPPQNIHNPRRWHSYAPRFWTGSRRTEHKFLPRRRSDSHDSIWFVAPAREQLALITGNRSHGISFG